MASLDIEDFEEWPARTRSDNPGSDRPAASLRSHARRCERSGRAPPPAVPPRLRSPGGASRPAEKGAMLLPAVHNRACPRSHARARASPVAARTRGHPTRRARPSCRAGVQKITIDPHQLSTARAFGDGLLGTFDALVRHDPPAFPNGRSARSTPQNGSRPACRREAPCLVCACKRPHRRPAAHARRRWPLSLSEMPLLAHAAGYQCLSARGALPRARSEAGLTDVITGRDL